MNNAAKITGLRKIRKACIWNPKKWCSTWPIYTADQLYQPFIVGLIKIQHTARGSRH